MQHYCIWKHKHAISVHSALTRHVCIYDRTSLLVLQVVFDWSQEQCEQMLSYRIREQMQHSFISIPNQCIDRSINMWSCFLTKRFDLGYLTFCCFIKYMRKIMRSMVLIMDMFMVRSIQTRYDTSSGKTQLMEGQQGQALVRRRTSVRRLSRNLTFCHIWAPVENTFHAFCTIV